MNISLHIDRLSLEGLPVTGPQRALLKAAVELELAGLLRNGEFSAVLRNGGAVPALKAASISMGQGKDPAALGKQIAQAVYGSLGTTGLSRTTTGWSTPGATKFSNQTSGTTRDSGSTVSERSR